MSQSGPIICTSCAKPPQTRIVCGQFGVCCICAPHRFPKFFHPTVPSALTAITPIPSAIDVSRGNCIHSSFSVIYHTVRTSDCAASCRERKILDGTQ